INCDAVCRNFPIGWRYPLHFAPVSADRAPAHDNLVVRSYYVIDRDMDVWIGGAERAYALFDPLSAISALNRNFRFDAPDGHDLSPPPLLQRKRPAFLRFGPTPGGPKRRFPHFEGANPLRRRMRGRFAQTLPLLPLNPPG